MTKREQIQLFEGSKVRTVWDDEREKWYFSIVDVVGVLTEQPNYDRAKNYWKVLKFRIIQEGNESVTNCNQLKMIRRGFGCAFNCLKRNYFTKPLRFRFIRLRTKTI